MQKRRRMWGWVFVAPQFIGLLIFALIPLVMSFVISFHDWDGIADTMKFVGVKNYVHQVMDLGFPESTGQYGYLFYHVYSAEHRTGPDPGSCSAEDQRGKLCTGCFILCRW